MPMISGETKPQHKPDKPAKLNSHSEGYYYYSLSPQVKYLLFRSMPKSLLDFCYVVVLSRLGFVIGRDDFEDTTDTRIIEGA